MKGIALASLLMKIRYISYSPQFLSIVFCLSREGVADNHLYHGRELEGRVCHGSCKVSKDWKRKTKDEIGAQYLSARLL